MLEMHKKPASRTICLRIPENVLEHLHRIARQRSVQMDRNVLYADLIREAIALHYPLPQNDILAK